MSEFYKKKQERYMQGRILDEGDRLHRVGLGLDCDYPKYIENQNSVHQLGDGIEGLVPMQMKPTKALRSRNAYIYWHILNLSNG